MANTPVSGIMTEQVFSLYDIGKPQITAELMARYGMQNQNTFNLCRSMTREAPVARSFYQGYEDNQYHRTVTVSANVGDPGIGNDIDFVIDSGDLDSSNRFYLRERDIITIPSTEVQAIVYEIDVTTPTAPVVTLKPVRSTDNIGALTAGTILPITSGAYGAGTDQPNGTIVGVEKRTFYTQVFKESVGVEGDQLANETWYKVYQGSSEKAIGYFTTGTMRAEYLMAQKIDGAFTIGQERTNASLIVPSGDDGAGNNINTTKGFVPHIRSGGYTFNYTSGSFDIDDLKDIGLYLRTQYVNSGNVLIMAGVKLSSDINAAAKDYFVTDTGANLTQIQSGMFGGAENMAGVLNFKIINIGDGFNYFIYVMDNWSNPNTFGVANLDFAKKGVILPVTSFKDPNPMGEGKIVDNFYTRYRAKGSYSRRFEVWNIAGAGGNPSTYVTSIDKKNWHYRAEMGLELYKTNQGIMMEPS